MKSYTTKSYARIRLVDQVVAGGEEWISYPILEIYDELKFRLIEKDEIIVHCNKKKVPTHSTNSVHQAIALLKKEFFKDGGVEVFIKKNIPVGAGLGGKRGNATAAVEAIRHLWKIKDNVLGLVERKVPEVSEHMHKKKMVYVTKHGVEPLKEMRIKNILIVVDVSHGERKGEYVPLNAAYHMRNIIMNRRKPDLKNIKHYIHNSYEKGMFEKAPKLFQHKVEMFRMGAETAFVTGKKGAVVGIFNTKRERDHAKEFFGKKHVRVYPT